MGVIQAGLKPNGAARVITVSCAADKGEAECKRLLQARARELARDGLPSQGATSRITVNAWSERWLEHTKRDLRPKSWATDRSLVKTWIVPLVGRKRLEDLTPADMRSVTESIRKAGRSSSTALRCQVIFTKMLKDAVVEGHLVSQRMFMMSAPGKSANDRDAVDLDDAIALLKAAAQEIDGSRWVAAFLQGMRQGECLGLTWRTVDLTAGTLDVSWQLQALPYISGRSGPLRVPDGYEYRQLDGGLCLVKPKTEQGQRIIPLVPWMGDALKAWRDLAPKSPHDLVWPRPDGRPRTQKMDSALWKDLQDTAQVASVDEGQGRRYALHEARHSTATLLLEAGTDPAVVKAIMGHSSIVTSRGYQHVSQSLARAALDGVAAKLQLSP